MRRKGFEVNAKRVARIQRRRHQGQEETTPPEALGISTADRQRAERPSQGWSWDTENGSCFRILPLLDQHTRQLSGHSSGVGPGR